MSTLDHLHAILASSSRGIGANVQDLYYKLVEAKPRLRALFDVEPRNEAEKRELQAGKVTLDGKTVPINQQFASESLCVSANLDISEYVAASLIRKVMGTDPNIDSTTRVEKAIHLFYSERSTIVACLQGIVTGSVDEVDNVKDVLHQYATNELFFGEPVTLAGGRRGGMGEKILEEVQRTGERLEKVSAAIRDARSDTNVQAGSLGRSTVVAIHGFLTSIRQSLAFLLFSSAQSRLLSPLDLSKLLRWTSEVNLSDDALPFVLGSILVTFSPSSETDLSLLLRDPTFPQFTTTFLSFSSSTTWKPTSPRAKGLKSILSLSWALLNLHSLHHEPAVPHQTLGAEEIEESIRTAIERDAFQSLCVFVCRASTSKANVTIQLDSLSYVNGLRSSLPELADPQQSEPLPRFFAPFFLQCVKALVLRLIEFAPSILKSIRTRQEDLLGAHSHSRFSSNAAQPPRSDIPAFFGVMALLFEALPVEEALIFWLPAPPTRSSTHGNLHKFLRWVLDVPIPNSSGMGEDLFRSAAGTIAALCHGKRCAEEAYNWLCLSGGHHDGEGIHGSSTVDSLFGWKNVWKMISTFRDHIPDLKARQQPGTHHAHSRQQQASQEVQITPLDIYNLAASLSVIRSIASNSARARISLYSYSPSSSPIKLLPTLISLIPTSIPLELKGTIFDVLRAFCEPGGGVAGVEVCKAVWNALEDIEVLGPSLPAGSSNEMLGRLAIAAGSGIGHELDEIETPHQRFPSSSPFVNLLRTLIHTPKAIPLSVRLLSYEPTLTVPEGLGSSRRLPGVLNYTSFVIDRVLLPILTGEREFADTNEKWTVLDSSLAYIENCLAAYTLEDLINRQEEKLEGQRLLQVTRRLLEHPGFGVLHELLTDSPLLSGILRYIHQGGLQLESRAANDYNLKSNPEFEQSLIRVLRIINRTLELQPIFSDVVVPLLADIDTAPIIGIRFTSSSIVGLDQRLVWEPDKVVSAALCIVHAESLELALMAIRVLSSLSGSNLWSTMDTVHPSSSFSSNILTSRGSINRLAMALDRNADSDQISAAFVRLLNEDGSEDYTQSEVIHSTGAGASLADDTGIQLTEALRWEILDLFVVNTTNSRPGPNIAHLLLGFKAQGGLSSSGALTFEDPHAQGEHTSSLHVVLQQLSKGSSQETSALPLFETNPVFAEKCYRLLYQLCTHSLTRDPTMRYLRTRENFACQQLSLFPSMVPIARFAGSPGVVHYGDHTQVPTTSEAVTTFLTLRSHLIEIVAQEVHFLTQSGQTSRILELMKILFGSTDDSQIVSEDDGLFGHVRAPEQGLLRIIELFHSFDFDWEESLATNLEPVDLVFFRSVNLMSAVRPDYDGRMLIDRDALLQMLQDTKVQSQAELLTPTAQEQMQLETTYILASCTIENHRREIQYAKGVGLDSWRRLLDVCLVKCFDRLSPDRRDSVLFELLLALPSFITSSGISQSASISLSETIVILMTKLREDRVLRMSLRAELHPQQSSALPLDKTLAIFKAILECILDPGVSEFVRGNLYAALINYFQLVDSFRPRGSSSAQDHSKVDDLTYSADLSASLRLTRGQTSSFDLEQGTLSVLNLVIDRVTHVISRDAIDGSEVWQSVAFTLLDSMVRVSRLEKQHRCLAALIKQGALNTFVSGLRDIDGSLEMIYLPDPMDLNPLFVYEARTSLLIRIAQTRQGADRLLEHRIFAVLAQSQFISAKPDTDRTSAPQVGNFLPGALQRYHQLLLPALQLIDSILASAGSASRNQMKQAFDFVIAHRETLVLLLKETTSQKSLSVIREQQILISLCTYLCPYIDRGQLGPSEFGPLHAAILGLASKCLGRKAHVNVVPSDDSELAASSTVVEKAGKSLTVFQVMVEEAFQSLRDTLIFYLGVSSKSSDSELRRVLSPRFGPSADNDNALASQPSLGDAISALHVALDQLSIAIHEIEALSLKLADKQSVSTDDIDKTILQTMHAIEGQPDETQRRSLGFLLMEKKRDECTTSAHKAMMSVEVLLLLIWRHVEYFQSGKLLEEELRESGNGLSSSQLLKRSQMRESLGSQNSGTSSLLNLVGALEGFDPPSFIFGEDSKSRESYLHVVCRKLRETISFGHEQSVVEMNGEPDDHDLPPY